MSKDTEKEIEEAKKRSNFIISHIGIIRVFALWGILDSLVFIFTKNDRLKSMLFYCLIFIVISMYGMTSPQLLDFI
jgi:hypothetical protein